jgi:hypothetical protein
MLFSLRLSLDESSNFTQVDCREKVTARNVGANTTRLTMSKAIAIRSSSDQVR